jgi:hypothetical protein
MARPVATGLSIRIILPGLPIAAPDALAVSSRWLGDRRPCSSPRNLCGRRTVCHCAGPLEWHGLLSCRAVLGNAVRLQVIAIGYSLVSFLRSLALPQEIDKLIKIGARPPEGLPTGWLASDSCRLGWWQMRDAMPA